MAVEQSKGKFLVCLTLDYTQCVENVSKAGSWKEFKGK
jgi:hypothetical protein